MHKVNIPCDGNFTIASHISLSESPPPSEMLWYGTEDEVGGWSRRMMRWSKHFNSVIIIIFFTLRIMLAMEHTISLILFFILCTAIKGVVKPRIYLSCTKTIKYVTTAPNTFR